MFLFFLMRFLTRVDLSCTQKVAVRGGLGSPSIPGTHIRLINKLKRHKLVLP